MRRSPLPILLACCLAAGCTASLPAGGAPAAGDYVRRLPGRDAGSRRAYRVHLPAAATLGGRSPLVVALHGAFSSGRGIAKRARLDDAADRHGFVAVYPEGFGFLGLLQHWNAEHCCGRAAKLELDHLGYVDAVIADVLAHVAGTDPARVYLVGESNGGMLVHRYVASRSRRVAAAAVVIGTISSRDVQGPAAAPPARPARPVPMLIVHGRDDEIVPFDGGTNARDDEREWASVAESAAFWVAGNEADPTPQVEELRDGAVVRRTWGAPASGAPVVVYELDGWGHDWPGPGASRPASAGEPLDGFDATETIWAFLERFTLDDGDGAAATW